MAREGFAKLVEQDRVKWEAFGVLPGGEEVRLLVERADASAVEPCDQAFLMLAWMNWHMSSVDDMEEDEEQLDREHTLVELAARVSSYAVESLASAAAPDRFKLAVSRTASISILTDGTRIDLMHLVGREEGSRGLYGLATLDETTALEVLVTAGAGCSIRLVPITAAPKHVDFV